MQSDVTISTALSSTSRQVNEQKTNKWFRKAETIEYFTRAWRLGFLAKKILRFFEISCQDVGNYSWQGSREFARLFKIVEKIPRRFLDLLSRKLRISKILARKPRHQAQQQQPRIFCIILKETY